MQKVLGFVVCIFLYIPCVTQAAVTISEIAWMGDVDSANHEWIELYNNGDAVDVSGWSLQDGMNLDIQLSGTIPANSYVVLERTSDESAKGAAFLIYTGALVNTGATLTLYRSDTSIEDQVAGGEDWGNVGGDNVTKETGQYTTKGWVTAEATPGASNATESSVKTASVTQPKASGGSPKLMSPATKEVKKLVANNNELQVVINGPAFAYVNQPIEFSVEASGLGKTLINSLSYQWNFGDLGTALSKEVSHVFAYPGTYLVSVEGSYGEYQASGRHEITVLPINLSITQNNNGDVQVNNDARYEVDLSGFMVSGTKRVTFPDNTVLLTNQTITIPKEKLGVVYGSIVQLYDAVGDFVTTSFEPEIVSAAEETNRVFPVSNIEPVSVHNNAESGFGFATSATEQVVMKAIPTEMVSVPVEPPEEQRTRWSYIALVGLISVAVIGVVLKPNNT